MSGSNGCALDASTAPRVVRVDELLLLLLLLLLAANCSFCSRSAM
jgi:hypothetical protein